MPIKLKIQKLGTLRFCVHFEIKLSKAKLKHLQLLHLENKKKMGKIYKGF